MNAYPRIATAYDLPFEVLVQPAPLLGGGGTVVLSIVPQTPPTPEATMGFKGVMMHFTSLAEAGALGGDQRPPWQSTIAKAEGPVAVGQNLEWTLAGTNLDERSLAVLVNLLLVAHDQHPLTRVSKPTFPSSRSTQRPSRSTTGSNHPANQGSPPSYCSYATYSWTIRKGSTGWWAS